MSRIAVCVISILLGVSVALAQLPTATILGQVKDSSGAAVAGARVTARNVDTGQTRTVVSGDDGAYRLAALPVGNYEITTEKSGFKTQVQSGLTLTVAQEAVVNFSIQVGEVSQTVSVVGEAPLVSTTNSTLGSLVNSERIADLPLNGRNYNNLTLLQPGVTQDTYVGSAIGFAGIEYSANGAPIRSNTYLLDGALMTNQVAANGASAIGTTLGVDGILEYRVMTNSFSAEYGITMGSEMLLVSKGGTNVFHGDAFEYIRNSDLDSRNFFDLSPAAIGHRLPEFRRNNFGGSVGGPIKKDKTFFFGVFEGLRQALGTTNTTNTLAPGCKGPAGTVITSAACPQLGVSSVTIGPQMTGLVSLYPDPNIPGTTEYGFGYAQPTTEDYGQMRVDQTISNSDTFFTRYTIDQASQISVGTFPNNTLPLGSRNQFLTLSENHIFSTSFLNTARFSFSRTNLTLTNPCTCIGPTLSYVTGQPTGATNVGTLTAIGTTVLAPKVQLQNIFTWSDDLIYTRGRHSLKFGFMINHFQDFTDSEGSNKGNPTFGSVATFLAGTMQSDAIVLPGSILDRTFHFDTFGIYVQDDWRVTSRLTLNLGLRYEPTTTVTETHGIQANYHNLLTDSAVTVGPYFRNPSLKNIGPRVGFAWDVAGNGHTAIKGGFGILYDQFTYGSGLGLAAQNGPPFDTSLSLGTGPITLPFVQPAGTVPILTYKGPIYDMRQPHMLQYNLAVERQLPGSMVLSVSYAGSRGIDLLQYKEGNPSLPNGIPVNAGTANETCASAGGAAINSASQSDGTATSCFLSGAGRLNHNLGTTPVNPGAGDSWYNAMEVVLTKRLSKGLQIQSSYTWARLFDDSASQAGADVSLNGAIPSDPLHNLRNRGPADFDVANNWHLNGIYYLPDFTSSSGFLSKIANGWWTSGIYSLQSGYPFTAFLSTNRSLDANSPAAGLSEYPDILPGRNNANITNGVSSGCGTGATRAQGGTAIAAGTPLHTVGLWYDPCAFSIQPLGFEGNAGRNTLRGPGFNNLDFSIVKDTVARFLGEAGKIEFRTEVFNIFNHPSFQSPGKAAVTTYAGTCPTATSALACGPSTPYAENPSAAAGTITATNGTSRQIQFALKVLF